MAVIDGQVVGARPLLTFRLAADGEPFLALQPADTMVHPDHRGQGLFTRMTRRAIDAYADREPELLFNFPNRQVWPGYRKLGWREAGARVTYYRVQDPEPLLAGGDGDRLGRTLGRAAAPAVTGYNRLRDWYADPEPDLAVEAVDGVPDRTLAALYRRRVPGRIHAVRDEPFYRWRFASPAWTRRTYLATAGETPVAALVGRTRETADGVRLAQVADVAPLDGDRQWRAGVASALERLLADHDDADLVAAPAGPFPRSLLRHHGFLPNDRPPLSSLRSARRTIAVRPLAPDDSLSWDRNGRSLTEPSNWLVTFAERDTA